MERRAPHLKGLISRFLIVDEAFYDPRLNQILSKFSATIDRNELRNAETDAREKSALEWKQVDCGDIV